MIQSPGRIAAIETLYKGYRFRSRLEARWAVFFDAMGLEWEYEPEGYNLGEAGYYLPDFWLPGSGVFVEIKGDAPSDNDTLKAYALARDSGKPVVMVVGLIDFNRELWKKEGWFLPDTSGIRIYFGNHRPSRRFGAARHMYDRIGPESEDGLQYHFRANNIPWPGFDGTDESLKEIARLDAEYFRAKYGKSHPRWEPYRGYVHDVNGGFLHDVREFLGAEGIHCEQIIAAINAARSARFEHGERGAAE